MIKKLTLLLFSVFLTSISIIAQTSLEGRVMTDGGEPAFFANVAVYKNDVLVVGSETDLDGYFAISNMDPGTYDVVASYTGFSAQKIQGVVVNANQANRLPEITLTQGVMLDDIVVVDYKVPLIDQDATSSGAIVTSEKIRNLPVKDINSIAAQSAGIASQDGGEINMRGARSNQTNYYIDGIRVNGKLPPQTEIEQLQVLTGGISAKYGDVTGGIISITTKGPSDEFSGYIEAETSEGLDPYGFTLANLSLSGPIIRRADRQDTTVKKTLLGFRAAVQYNFQRDDDPPATEIFRASEETIERLGADPLTRFNGAPITQAERVDLTNGVERWDYQPNEEQRDLDVVVKLDSRVSDNIDFSLTGTYNNATDRFSPGARTTNNNLAVFRGIGRWDVFNWVNNPEEVREIYRGVFRFRHRVGAATSINAEGEKNTSFVQNLSYFLQAGFERRLTSREDWRHKENLFDYGHVGNFDRRWDTIIGRINNGSGEDSLFHAGYVPRMYNFNGSEANPFLANYNNVLLEDPNDIFGYQAFNGTLSDLSMTSWNIHSNVGTVYNRFRKQERDRYTANIALSFDIVPGGESTKGRHNIELGVNTEQWVERLYEVRPIGLWSLARLYANQHILGLGTDSVGTFDGITVFQSLIDESVLNDPERKFYRSVRELKFGAGSINQTIDDFVNVDDIDPGQLSLDMFSARELTDQNVVSYYGYDYLGNKTDLGTGFDDFFTLDENGQRSFNVAPITPLYGAAYIQDRFTYKDIIFRLGLRLDYYDANTQVLKDKYSLYPILNASDFHELDNTSDRPSSVDADYKVYTDGPASKSVLAYRDGDDWFDPNGTQVDPRTIFGEGIVNPYYQGIEQGEGFDDTYDPQNLSFDQSQAFEDYDPQWNLMPRLGFSFPISDEANFFAHYDVLVSRPLSRNIATALDYFYWAEINRTPTGNPNLKPVRTIDYQVGFQQKLTNSSAIKLAAYYKEFRDLIQQRTLLFTSPAPINNFQTFDNLDFGTVKGFTFQYDLRRTKNIELTAAYTLQFADGTGSDDDSQDGLTSNGRNIRTLAPLSYDERHRLVLTADYRFDSGKKYNGPRLFGSDIFANAGANFQLTAVSGRPFTSRAAPTRFGGTQIDGSINGSRLPWTFRLDTRIDKSFRINSADAAKPLFVNVYFRVQNLFDTRNVVSVYTASGSPDDDGFIDSSFGQNQIRTLEQSGRQEDIPFFLEQYNWRLLNPDNFTRPRRLYVGAIFDF